MHPIAELIARKIADGIGRRAIGATGRCSLWAKKYRVMGSPFPGPWTFKHHPWLEAMHDSDAEMNIGQKSAQMGYTETVLNRVLYNIDMFAMDCLYILPASKPDANDFSSGRFSPAIESSQHLKDLFSDVSNVGHKRAGTANLYIRGSHSRSQLKSIPVGFVVADEKDEMSQENVPLIFQRQAGQVVKEAWQISTPTHHDYGINKDYNLSSQNHFYFRCPMCSRFIELEWLNSLVILGDNITDKAVKDSYLQCTGCKGKLNHEDKASFLSTGKWIETVEDREVKGWYINQLYSAVIKPSFIAAKTFAALSDPYEAKELNNSMGGIPYTVDGSSVTDGDIETCLSGSFKILTSSNSSRVITMGIDVGYPQLHIEIDEWILPDDFVVDISAYSKPRVLYMGRKTNFDQLDDLMYDFNVNYAVIDSQPERRMALDFANRFYGRVSMCTYEQGITGKVIKKDENEPRVSVDRTAWLDLALSRFRTHE